MGSHKAGVKDWIYRQYDQRVGSSTSQDCSKPVGAIALPSGRALGVVLGCRPHIMRLDAYVGGVDSIFYPAIELASKGFEALAVTDCLNFGNPEKKEVMTEFVASLDGMNKACEALVTPIISGNVSFYNETFDKGISPTPSTGLVGLRPTIENIPESSFRAEGDMIYLITLGTSKASGYQSEVFKEEKKLEFDENLSELAQKTKELCQLVQAGQVNASRISGNFGLAYTLSRMSLSGLGAEVHCEEDYFTESFYRVILTVPPKKAHDFETVLKKTSLSWKEMGRVKGSKLVWRGLQADVETLRNAYEQSWDKAFPRLS